MMKDQEVGHSRHQITWKSQMHDESLKFSNFHRPCGFYKNFIIFLVFVGLKLNVQALWLTLTIDI